MKSLPIKHGPFRWGDWLTVGLLIIIIQIAAARLVATSWTKDLHQVQVVALLGTILGLALGKSIFKRFWVVFFIIAYGIIIIPWQLGVTLEPEIHWLDRLTNLWGRLGVVVSDVITREPITDNLLFFLLMAALFWIIAIYSGYVMLRQGNPWKVVIPGGITIFVIHAFDPLLVSRSWYLAFYLFFSLILVARMVYLSHSMKWKESRTHTPPDVGFDFIRATLIISMVLVFFAWNVPVLAETFKPAAQIWQTAARPWLTTKDRFGYIFASLRASVGLVKDFYGDVMVLGLGTPLSDQVVMEVEAPTSLPNGYRFYWAARNYSTYETNHWRADQNATKNLTPDSINLNQPGVDIRPEVETTFSPHTAISNLFTAPEPLWLNKPAQARVTVNPDGLVDFESLSTKQFVRPGEKYTVRSAVDAVTIKDLQDAGTAYPAWVLDEYLQLPGNITPRTRELALEIAAGLTNPYDIASEVTDYLRNNIEYTLSVETPPANQERVDWFLFDYGKGFCNYYATAEVVLLRSLGIPARMSVGFAEGDRQVPPMLEDLPTGVDPDFLRAELGETATYVVREKDAHAWPEVYFPGIGWVIFEPTASQPELFRPSGVPFENQEQNIPEQNQEELNNPQEASDLNRLSPEERDPASAAETESNFWTFGNIVKLIILAFAIFLLVVVLWQVRRGFRVKPFLEQVSIEMPELLEKGLQRIGIRPPQILLDWIQYRKLPLLSRAYMEINHALRRIGIKPDIQDTPSERTAMLVRAIPQASAPGEKLLAEYQLSMYTPYPANQEVAHTAGIEIRKLSWMARLSQILARFQEPNRR